MRQKLSPQFTGRNVKEPDMTTPPKAITFDEACCHVCGSTGYSPFTCHSDYHILICDVCGLRYLWPQPHTQAIEDTYSKEYFTSSHSISRGYGDYLADAPNHRTTFRNRLKLLPQPAGDMRLMDVGAAAGFFVEQATLAGWQAEGVEPNDFMATYAREKLGAKVRTGTLTSLSLPSNHFDVVTLWEVIEHLPQPRQLLIEARRLTRSGGLLALSTPDCRSIVARLSGKRWLGWKKVPEHLYFFTRPTLIRLLSDVGFQVVVTKYVSITVTLGFALDRLGDMTGLDFGSLPGRLRSTPFDVNPYYDLFVLARAR
ncbi:MAG: class I SAM-dependent methyltransferase [Gemmatimonadales bacterium]|nr:class I SAM-dependent methyltransferase [Gemmatimonadales bacterium]